jgi:chromosome segregation ATPase
MPGQAQITSVAALEAFRSDLIVFLAQMSPVLDEVGSEVVRLKHWLQNDQRELWEKQARKNRQRLEEAQAELFNTRLSKLQESSSLQQMLAQRARQAVQQSEQKLGALKKWERELENQTEPLLKQVDQLQGFLANDMGRAIAYLTQIIQTLEAYAEVLPPGAAAVISPADGTRTTS